jgi:hypothetical protein
MSLNTNKLSLINPDKISSPLHIDIPDKDQNSPTDICTTPNLSPREFTDYDKFCNEKDKNIYVKEKQEFKLPDIKTQQVQDNFQQLFYKRTEIKKNEQLPQVKKITPPKIGQMATYGRMTFVYQGGF